MKIGIYIHIPFCIRKCAYCDFLSGPASRIEQNQYMERLTKEIQFTANQYENLEVASLFFGGGTPSSVEPKWIVTILNTIRAHFFVSSDVEITMECNPGTLTKENVEIYKNAGVNRISLGLQSANNKELALLGRIHTWEQFLESYKIVRDAGITNVNIDLMSALPNQTMETWQETLKKVTALNPEHISAYSLIIEPGTPFYEAYEEHPELLPSEEEDREMYAWTKKWLQSKGYERYEISNYAKKGKECRHNNFYWTGVSYLGFGIGASSLYRNIRYTNISDRFTYIKEENLDAIREEVHENTIEEQMEEFAFLGLRRMEGISKLEFLQRFHRTIEDVYGDVLTKYILQGFLEQKGDKIRLTDEGIDVSNVILAEFLLC